MQTLQLVVPVCNMCVIVGDRNGFGLESNVGFRVNTLSPQRNIDNLGAVDVEFTPDDLARLDAATALKPEYPGWMIERQSGYRR